MFLPVSSRRRPMAAAIAFLAVAGAFRPAPTQAQQQPQSREEKAASRPSQAAVLAENSVLHADEPYGKDDLQRLDVYAPRGPGRLPSSFSCMEASGRGGTRRT